MISSRISRVSALLILATLCGTTLIAQDRPARKKVLPVYPEMARRMGVTGRVKLQLSVDPQGKVQDVRVVQGRPFLRDAAVSAARQWTFANAPEPSTEVIEVVFRP